MRYVLLTITDLSERGPTADLAGVASHRCAETSRLCFTRATSLTVCISGELQAPIEKVWELIGNFADLMNWHPGVEKCTTEGVGIGSTRTIYAGGNVAIERLERLDSAAHSIGYSVQAGGFPSPLIGMKVDLVLTAISGGRTRIDWTAGLPDDEENAAEVDRFAESYYPKRIEHLRSRLGCMTLLDP
jgi:carbon monoxide dehydrogenase subunit G